MLSEHRDSRSRVYYGEQSPDYSVVGKSSEDDRGRRAGPELFHGRRAGGGIAEDADSETTYDGEGGVDVGSTFRQLMYAVKFGETNFLLSGRVNENSRVLYNREPVTRVEKVAPVADARRRPLPGRSSTAGSSGSSTATRRPTATRTPSASRSSR